MNSQAPARTGIYASWHFGDQSGLSVSVIFFPLVLSSTENGSVFACACVDALVRGVQSSLFQVIRISSLKSVSQKISSPNRSVLERSSLN